MNRVPPNTAAFELTTKLSHRQAAGVGLGSHSSAYPLTCALMAAVVIQGASRGIGLGFVRALLDRDDATIHATCRQPGRADNLQEMARRQPERIRIHGLDVTDEASVEAASQAILSESPELKLLVNASGVLHGPNQRPERRLEDLNPQRLLDIFAVNAIGPLIVVKHLLSGFQHDRGSVVASLSARVGSIGDNRRGGWYGYRASKAALNQMHKSLAVELSRRARKAVAVTLHPGTVQTRLTEPFRRSVPEGTLFPVEKSVDLLLAVIDGLTPADHGKFFDYSKAEIEW